MRAVNLIPSDQRSGGNVGGRSGGAAFLVLGLLGGLVVLALLYGLSAHRISSRRAEAAALTAKVQQVEAQAARLAPYTSFIALREQRVQAVAQLVGSRFDWSNAMGELSRVLPSDVAITSLQGTVGAASATTTSTSTSTSTAAAAASSVSSATPPGTTPTFTLAGCATSQAIVAQTLVRLRLLSGVSAVSLQSSTKAGGGSSGSCTGSDPVFSVQVSFDPLPATSTSSIESGGSAASASTSPSSSVGGAAASAHAAVANKTPATGVAR